MLNHNLRRDRPDLSPGKNLLKGFLTVLVVLLVLSVLQADAQRRKDPWSHYGGGGGGSSSESGYAMMLNIDYDTPAGTLGNTFNAAPALNLGVLRYLGSFIFNATIGYHAYNPKQAIFSYDDGAGGTGTVVYDKYTVFAIYAGAVYNLKLADGVGLYAGMNWGVYATHYAYNAVDQFSASSANLNEEDLYFAPKLGFNAMLNDRIGLGIEAKYNFFSPSGNSSTNPDAGTIYKSYAAGLVLTYKL
jgi:hypothetical protein